jgi:TIR domain
VREQPRAFISHSSKDLPFARRLGERLRSQGIEVWLDDLQLKVGDTLTETIARAVGQHDFLIVVLSKASLASAWVRKEVRMATPGEARGRVARLVPILLERPAANRLPKSLRDTKYVDFSDYKTFEVGLAELLDLMADDRSTSRPRKRIEGIEFIHGDQLTAALKNNIERILTEYEAYIHRLGFRSKNGAFEISFENSKNFISYYDPIYDRIVTNIDYAGEEDYLRRDYTHHVLATTRLDLWNRASVKMDLGGIESGLAAYFPCSFKGRHLFGDGAAHLAGQSVPLFDLTNTRQTSEIKNTTESIATAGLEVWGGMFWRLRTELGSRIADRLLWRAWSAMRGEVKRFDLEFIRCLVKFDGDTYKGRHVRQITGVFAERGIGTITGHVR